MEYVIVWIVCSIACAVIAHAKQRSVVGWFLLGMLLGIIGIIIVAVLPSNEPRKICPFCRGSIPLEATICKYCSRNI